MLRKIGQKLGINTCPLHLIKEIGDKIVKALQGKVSDDVLAILQKGLSRFAPEKGDQKNFRSDLWEHLELNYAKRGGDNDILHKWAQALGSNLDECKKIHEELLGREDMNRRSTYPDIWSADNIFYGLKHMNALVGLKMLDIYGQELCDRLPLRLARNLSLLFYALNDWIAGTKDDLFNPVFHAGIDTLEQDAGDCTSHVMAGDMTSVHKSFHAWVVPKCSESMTDHVLLMGDDPERIQLFDTINFFIGPSRLNIHPFEAGDGLAHAMRAGLDSAISIFVMILMKISKEIPGNTDGSMSDDQNRIWSRSLRNFIVPSAKSSHAWAGHFFSVTKTHSSFGPDLSENTLNSLIVTGNGDQQYVAIQPEMQAALILYMMKLGLPRNSCPALKSSGGKVPAMFRLADLIQKWYSENKIQALIIESDATV